MKLYEGETQEPGISLNDYTLTYPAQNTAAAVKTFNVFLEYENQVLTIEVTISTDCDTHPFKTPVLLKDGSELQTPSSQSIVAMLETMEVSIPKEMIIDSDGVSWSTVCSYAEIFVTSDDFSGDRIDVITTTDNSPETLIVSPILDDA